MERNSESTGSEDEDDPTASVLFDATPDPTFVVEADGGRVVAVNEAALDVLGKREAAVVGTDLGAWFPDDSDRIRRVLRRSVEPGSSDGTTPGGESVLRIATDDGDCRRVEAHTRPVEVGGRDCVGISLRPVPTREHHHRVLERLQRATDRLAGAGSREEVADLTADVADDVLGASLYSVFLYDHGRDALVEAATSDAAADAFEGTESVARGQGVVWKAFERNEVLVYGDVSEDPAVYDPETNVRSEIVAPIGEYGALVVSSPRVDEFDAADVSLVKTLATNAAAALTRMDRERRLRNQTRKLRTIIENAPIVLFALDEDGVFTVSEGKGLQRMGLEPGTAVGQSVFDLYAEHEDVCDDVRRALDGESIDRIREVGGRIHETWYRPVDIRNGEVSPRTDEALDAAVIGASIDVTERERRERLVRVLNRFLRHNLRNAMNVVVGYAQRIDGHDDDEVQTAVDRIAETGAELTRLSEKARRLSEMAATERDVGTVDVRQSVDRVTADLEELYDVEVTLRGVERRPLVVPETVELAIREICENAVKHPGDPAPTVSVTFRERPRVAVVDVRDGGPGLPDQERAMLESEGETPLKHGSGLGLFVAYWAVSDSGGEIDVWKSDDEGTGITITVPIVNG